MAIYSYDARVGVRAGFAAGHFGIDVFEDPLEIVCRDKCADAGKRQITIDRRQLFSAIRRDLHQLRSYLNDAGLSHG